MLRFPTHTLIMLFLLLMLSCEKEKNTHVTDYAILQGACGTITLIDDIGTDFSSALDSLKSIRASFIGNDYIIEEVDMEIDYSGDDREFRGIRFTDPGNQTLLFAMSDVLDSDGNYYLINWCPD